MYARSIFDDLADFRRSFDQIFEGFQNATHRGVKSEWAFMPAVETGWTDDFLNLRVVLPGVTQEDLKLTVQGNQVVVQGELKAPQDFGKEGMVFNQLAYGKFERTIDLPAGLETEKLQAHLHDGLLDIRIPLAQAVKPRQVKITAGATAKTIAAA